MPKMPDSISDGYDYDDWLERRYPDEEDEDDAYERLKASEIDEENNDNNQTH